jgi:hypothetical protein
MRYAYSMKTCNFCFLELPVEQFSWSNKKNGKRSTRCKACQKIYDAKHYSLNRERKLADSKERGVEYRKESRKVILDYLRLNPCIDCGIDDIRVLQFDHRDPVGGKGKRISNFLGSPNAVIREIAKCDVRCANCHMIRTQQQFGWERI